MRVLPEFKVIAEVGCNHMGDLSIAFQMIEAAAWAGAYAVKFQKRNPIECLGPRRYDQPYTSPNSFGRTYGEHREFLELSVDQHFLLADYARKKGIRYASSVWDISSLRQIAELHPPWIKIPSAHNEDWPLLYEVAKSWGGYVHVSTGMSEQEIADRHREFFCDRWVPYACTSTYPTPPEDVRLLDVCRLLDKSMDGGSGYVGWSGHYEGMAYDVPAVLLGATYVERHFTLNRSWKGTDQKASLEPPELKGLVDNLLSIKVSWRDKGGILESEWPCVEKLKGKTRKTNIKHST